MRMLQEYSSPPSKRLPIDIEVLKDENVQLRNGIMKAANMDGD